VIAVEVRSPEGLVVTRAGRGDLVVQRPIERDRFGDTGRESNTDAGCEKLAAVSVPLNSTAMVSSRNVPVTARPIAAGVLLAASARCSLRISFSYALGSGPW